jgi:HAD superfamily hydrolase (TIGR01509 family)
MIADRMTLTIRQIPHWDAIDTVLLDLDGTLLDLAYDNFLWLARVPQLYAAARGLSLEQAASELAPRFRAREGTLEWYCIDYWSRELALDIAALHREESARIAWLPGARAFLEILRARGKRLVLLTNAHPVTLDIKHAHTGVRQYFDAAYSSHSFGAPKEHSRFWDGVSRAEPFEPARTLFVDDSLPVLRAARSAGIRWIYAVRRPDSSQAPRAHAEFLSIDGVDTLLRAG